MKLPEWLEKSGDIFMTLITLLIMGSIGFVIVYFQNISVKSSAALWSLACIASGAVIGFLFGIPRVSQEETQRVVAQPNNLPEPKPGPATQTPYRLQVNTNLEQISDWLTKIIVGVGLIEMRNFPDYMNRASVFIGNGLGGDGNTKVFAGAMILYFALLGFLGGYLLTRLYLTGAFKRADIEAVVNVAGNELTVQEANRQIRDFIGDLQTQIVEIQQKIKGPDTTGEKSVYEVVPKVRSILWVDDFPKNNSLIIDYLNRLKIEVVTVLTTEEALAKLKTKKFDRIISDMGRVEGGITIETAGIILAREVKKAYPDIPVIIYCSAPKATAYRSEALEAGAVYITPSQTELIEALKLFE